MCAQSSSQTHAELTVAHQGQDGSRAERLALAASPLRAPATPKCAHVSATQPSLEPDGVSPWGEQNHLRIRVDSGAGGQASQSLTEWGWPHLTGSQNQWRRSYCHYVLHLLPHLSLSWVSQTCHLPWSVILS